MIKAQFSEAPQTILESELCSPAYSLAADLDQDGLMDLVISSASENRIYWHRNTGGQVFQRQLLVETPFASPQEFYLFDLEQDGDLDIAIFYPSGWGVLINEGAEVFETFQLIKDQFTDIRGFAAEDIDQDGDVDLVVDNLRSVWLSLNQGDGTFTNTIVATSFSIQTFETRLVNLDDTPDLEILVKNLTNDPAQTHSIYKFDADTQEMAFQTFVGIPAISAFQIEDWDQDGLNDFIYANQDISWKKNQNRFIFAAPTPAFDLPGEAPLHNLVFADFNQDQYLDFIVWSLGTPNDEVQQIYLGTDTNTFSVGGPLPDYGQFSFPNLRQFIDMDGDQDLDLLVTSGSLFWLEFSEEGFVKRHDIYRDEIPFFVDMLQADVDQDQDPDLLMWSRRSQELSWVPNNLEQGMGTLQKMDIGMELSAFTVADIDNDGDQDAIMYGKLDSTSSRLTFGFQLTNARFADDTLQPIPLDPQVSFLEYAVGDLDNDQDLDIAYFASGRLYWLENDDLNFKPHLIETLEIGMGPLKIKDLNKDGYADLILSLFPATHTSMTNLYWTPNHPNGGFHPTTLIVENIPLATHIEVLDLDRDGTNELIVGSQQTTNTGGGLLRFSKNEALDTWDKTVIDHAGTAKLAVVDLNEDDRLDLLQLTHSYYQTGAGEFGNEVVYFLQDSTGQLIKSTLTNNPLRPTSFLQVADFDLDGAHDLVIGNNTCQHFLYYKNNALLLTSTQQVLNQATFNLFPNPVQDVLIIETETTDWLGKAQFQLYNSVGALIKNERLDDFHQQISTSDLPKGIYFYTIRGLTGKSLASGKIVK